MTINKWRSHRPGLLSGSGQVFLRMCMVAPDWIPQASSVRSSLSLRPQCTSSDMSQRNISSLDSDHGNDAHAWIDVSRCHRCSRPIRSGSGMESGSCAATSCFKVATLYPPGGTSPGIISGKVKVDLGWSTSFKDSCQSEEDISTLWIRKTNGRAARQIRTSWLGQLQFSQGFRTLAWKKARFHWYYFSLLRQIRTMTALQLFYLRQQQEINFVGKPGVLSGDVNTAVYLYESRL